MKKKLQIILTDETWASMNTIVEQANMGFRNGSISYSDIINELVLTAKIDIKSLQLKHTNIRKSLRLLATEKEIDIDSAIKTLMDLKNRTTKKSTREQSKPETLGL